METPSSQSLMAHRWRDAVNLLLGIWLFITPWIFGFSLLNAAMTDAFWIFGGVIFVFGILGLATPGLWADWITLVGGILVIVLGVAGTLLLAFKVDAIVAGALVTLLSIWTIYDRRRVPLDVI